MRIRVSVSGECGLCGMRGLMVGAIVDASAMDRGKTVWLDLCESCWEDCVKIYNVSTKEEGKHE